MTEAEWKHYVNHTLNREQMRRDALRKWRFRLRHPLWWLRSYRMARLLRW